MRVDGSHLWVEASFRFVDDDAGPSTEIELVDITSEMAGHEKLVARERLLDGLTRSLPVGVLQIDGEGVIHFSNHAVGNLTGVDQPTTVNDAFANVVDEERPLLDRAIEGSLRNGEDRDVEVRLAPAPGAPDKICSLIIRPLAGDDGEPHGAVICVQDVTAQAMARADLETRLMLDPLTRSLNRDGIMASLRRCLGAPADGDHGPWGGTASATTVIYIDLDRFKQVNDRFGHRAGDRMLRTATERIQRALRVGDLVGRIGGDEFVAICAGVSSPAEAMAIAGRVADLIAQPLPDETAPLQASIGVVTALPGDSRTAEALIADGDAAMYESKRAGAGQPVLFTAATGADDGST
jgi:diguanylate cyclase (GGDEF)-like protein/PAS domain S-box-containing protein